MERVAYQGINIYKDDPKYITEFSKTLLDDFYKREDETISQALSRPAVAYCYGDYELAQRIYDYVYNGWFMYASPVLSNATRGHWKHLGFNSWNTSYEFVPHEKPQGQPISCFAFDVGDTTVDQVNVLQELANLSLSGGGTGAHMSIRAIGGKAPGPIPYMKVMDGAIGYFRQGTTRKGAIAAYQYVTHPDIIEHIRFRKPGGDSKRRSDNRQQFHNAVNLTDDFIAAVENDTTYDLVCPHSGKVHGTLRARYVWEEILETRALTGEPYLLKIDEANRKMPETQKALGLKIRGSNLCVAPETQILTDIGYQTISELENEKVNVWNGKEFSEVIIRKTGVDQKLIKVTTDSGQVIECTPYHKFYVKQGFQRDGKDIAKVAKDLTVGDKIIKLVTPVIEGADSLNLAYQNGFFSGDGCVVVQGSQVSNRVYLYGEKRSLRHLFEGHADHWYTQDNHDREYFNVGGLKPKFFVPDAAYTVQSRLEWLAGLLDSDGTVARCGNSQCLQVANVEEGFLEAVQIMLQTLGVQSKVKLARNAGRFLLPANDGTGDLKEFECKQVKRLLVSGMGIVQLMQLGLKTHRLVISNHIPNRNAENFVKVLSVTDEGRTDDTYCFTELKRGMGVFNGVLTGQCSEIVLPTDSERTFVCCLSSLNMEKFEEWKDTRIVQDLIRFLDNVLQSFIEEAPLNLHKAVYSATRERAVGLGTLGWHGYLQSKLIPFEGGGFNSAVQHTHKLYGIIAERAEEESRQLAKERGEPEDMKGTGLRNSRTTAIAPNANSADLLDTSPSIEPYFRNVFIKSTRAGNFTVKNRHLQKVLQKYGEDTDETWAAVNANEGRVDNLAFLTDEEKLVFKTAMETDMHWVIEHAEHRGQALGKMFQAQSLNVYFPFGSSRKYVNSVHRKFLNSPNVLTMYYYRSEREGVADNAKAIERRALVDWSGEDCVACSG